MDERMYRVSRDKWMPMHWSVQCWRWWWPFWTEEIGLLNTYAEAVEMVDILREGGR